VAIFEVTVGKSSSHMTSNIKSIKLERRNKQLFEKVKELQSINDVLIGVSPISNFDISNITSTLDSSFGSFLTNPTAVSSYSSISNSNSNDRQTQLLKSQNSQVNEVKSAKRLAPSLLTHSRSSLLASRTSCVLC